MKLWNFFIHRGNTDFPAGQTFSSEEKAFQFIRSWMLWRFETTFEPELEDDDTLRTEINACTDLASLEKVMELWDWQWGMGEDISVVRTELDSVFDSDSVAYPS